MKKLNPLEALVFSKIYSTGVFWAVGVLLIAYFGKATSEATVEIIKAASWVLAAMLLAQGYKDAHLDPRATETK